jgi:16S rRNA (cytidine1402-2'-O)-methyltransferase
VENGLYIVSTPIGNLKDITLRALDVLKDVDFIACEDTRTSNVLLNHYDIRKELISLNAVNEKNRISLVLNRIAEGSSCALISDAGTPGISDPGIRLISAAIKEGINVIPVPGPVAAITALTLSGLPSDSFVFEGFLPQKKGRQKLLQQLSEEERTIIYMSLFIE